MLTRAVLAQASGLVARMSVIEHDIVNEESEAERLGIRVAPTVIVSGTDGAEVFRAEGVPSLNQVLVALAKAV
jgi:protein-disulfide isomerase